MQRRSFLGSVLGLVGLGWLRSCQSGESGTIAEMQSERAACATRIREIALDVMGPNCLDPDWDFDTGRPMTWSECREWRKVNRRYNELTEAIHQQQKSHA